MVGQSLLAVVVLAAELEWTRRILELLGLIQLGERWSHQVIPVCEFLGRGRVVHLDHPFLSVRNVCPAMQYVQASVFIKVSSSKADYGWCGICSEYPNAVSFTSKELSTLHRSPLQVPSRNSCKIQIPSYSVVYALKITTFLRTYRWRLVRTTHRFHNSHTLVSVVEIIAPTIL